jgi:hypothetical protein
MSPIMAPDPPPATGVNAALVNKPAGAAVVGASAENILASSARPTASVRVHPQAAINQSGRRRHGRSLLDEVEDRDASQFFGPTGCGAGCLRAGAAQDFKRDDITSEHLLDTARERRFGDEGPHMRSSGAHQMDGGLGVLDDIFGNQRSVHHRFPHGRCASQGDIWPGAPSTPEHRGRVGGQSNDATRLAACTSTRRHLR